MKSAELLAEAFGRIGGMVHDAIDGLSDEELTYRIDGGSNPIAWLVWHLARVQDDHVAGVAGTEQVWMTKGWAERFDLPLPIADHGYGHSDEQVAMVKATAEQLAGYYDAVERATLEYVRGLSDDDLDRVVDTHWDPPVTLGARLVSVIGDDVAHAAQAAYVRGILERR
ncbi:MAG: mycothiol transferase [Acidimicrobiales bacterium]